MIEDFERIRDGEVDKNTGERRYFPVEAAECLLESWGTKPKTQAEYRRAMVGALLQVEFYDNYRAKLIAEAEARRKV